MIAPQPIRIAIADDHALVRQGIALLVECDAALAVVADVGDADGIPRMLARRNCDVLLLDLDMDRNTLADIASLARLVKVIVLTGGERVPDAAAAVRAGARGLVTKRNGANALIDAIHTVASGGTWIPPEFADG